MNGDFQLDVDEIVRNIETAQIVCLHFPLLRKTLVVDTRTDGEDPPIVRLLPMASSVEDRLRTIRELRPTFPQPEKVVVIPWPKYVDSLLRLGIWDKLVSRLRSAGGHRTLEACGELLDELRQLEKDELVAVITGDQYYTLWESPRAG